MNFKKKTKKINSELEKIFKKKNISNTNKIKFDNLNSLRGNILNEIKNVNRITEKKSKHIFQK